MAATTLSEALEQEHRAIDRGIEAYVAGLEGGSSDAAPLTGALASLRRHIYLEEEFLFPPLRGAGLMAPIFVMLKEHGEMWHVMEALEQQVAAAGDDAAQRGPLADAARGLLAVLANHNTKEEPIIYPEADRALSEPASDDLKDFLHEGVTPDGWTCQQA